MLLVSFYMLTLALRGFGAPLSRLSRCSSALQEQRFAAR